MALKKSFEREDAYCWNCGAKRESGRENCPACGAVPGRFGAAPALGAGGVGWSDRANHPSFAAHLGRKRRRIWFVLTVVSLAIVALAAYFPTLSRAMGIVSTHSESIPVALVALLIAWAVGWVFLHANGMRQPDWEGVATGKLAEEYAMPMHAGPKRPVRSSRRTMHIIHFLKDDGSEETLSYSDAPAWYASINEGDRVRFHGQNGTNYCEKYDKSKDAAILCAGCRTLRDARENFYARCGCVILKGRQA